MLVPQACTHKSCTACWKSQETHFSCNAREVDSGAEALLQLFAAATAVRGAHAIGLPRIFDRNERLRRAFKDYERRLHCSCERRAEDHRWWGPQGTNARSAVAC